MEPTVVVDPLSPRWEQPVSAYPHNSSIIVAYVKESPLLVEMVFVSLSYNKNVMMETMLLEMDVMPTASLRQDGLVSFREIDPYVNEWIQFLLPLLLLLLIQLSLLTCVEMVSFNQQTESNVMMVIWWLSMDVVLTVMWRPTSTAPA